MKVTCSTCVTFTSFIQNVTHCVLNLSLIHILLWPLTGRARTEETPPRVILVVNSYLESSPWSSTIISALSRFGADRDDLGVLTEHMNVLMIGDRERLAEFERMSVSYTHLDVYKRQPQSRSRLTARGCNPPSSQLLHWP